jgi:hypothetical protein
VAGICNESSHWRLQILMDSRLNCFYGIATSAEDAGRRLPGAEDSHWLSYSRGVVLRDALTRQRRSQPQIEMRRLCLERC